MFESLFNGVREKQVCHFPQKFGAMAYVPQSKGLDRPSLVGTLIKDADKYGLSARENSWVAAIM
jgi:hypothetical protein